MSIDYDTAPIADIIAHVRKYGMGDYNSEAVERLCAEVERLQEMYESGSDLSQEEIREVIEQQGKIKGFECDIAGMPERPGRLI